MTAYQRLVGKLMYLTITKPEICFGVQVLCQFIRFPKVLHWDVIRLVRYVKGSPRLGVLMKMDRKIVLTGYYDSYWVSCPNTKRLVTWYVVKLGDSLISWKSMKQPTVSRGRV